MKKGILQNLKLWLDDEENDPLEEITNPGPPRKADEFMTKIAKRLDATLQDEMFVPLNKYAQTPGKFVVYLNKTDDLYWQGAKRRALEETLSETIFERACEIVQPNGLSVEKIDVEIRLDTGLVHPMFQVTAVWNQDEPAHGLTIPALEQLTVIETDYSTRTDFKPLFTVRLKRDGSGQIEMPFYKDEIYIGRGSATQRIDIYLSEPNISRLQVVINQRGNDLFMLTNLGKNTIFVDGRAIFPEHAQEVHPLQQIRIGNYSLALIHEITAPAQFAGHGSSRVTIG